MEISYNMGSKSQQMAVVDNILLIRKKYQQISIKIILNGLSPQVKDIKLDLTELFVGQE